MSSVEQAVQACQDQPHNRLFRWRLADLLYVPTDEERAQLEQALNSDIEKADS